MSTRTSPSFSPSKAKAFALSFWFCSILFCLLFGVVTKDVWKNKRKKLKHLTCVYMYKCTYVYVNITTLKPKLKCNKWLIVYMYKKFCELSWESIFVPGVSVRLSPPRNVLAQPETRGFGNSSQRRSFNVVQTKRVTQTITPLDIVQQRPDKVPSHVDTVRITRQTELREVLLVVGNAKRVLDCVPLSNRIDNAVLGHVNGKWRVASRDPLKETTKTPRDDVEPVISWRKREKRKEKKK